MILKVVLLWPPLTSVFVNTSTVFVECTFEIFRVCSNVLKGYSCSCILYLQLILYIYICYSYYTNCLYGIILIHSGLILHNFILYWVQLHAPISTVQYTPTYTHAKLPCMCTIMFGWVKCSVVKQKEFFMNMFTAYFELIVVMNICCWRINFT